MQEARHFPRSESCVHHFGGPLSASAFVCSSCSSYITPNCRQSPAPLAVWPSSIASCVGERAFWEGIRLFLPVSSRPVVPSRSSPFLHCTRPDSWASPPSSDAHRVPRTYPRPNSALRSTYRSLQTLSDGVAAVIASYFSLNTLLYGVLIQGTPKRREDACKTSLTNVIKKDTKSH